MQIRSLRTNLGYRKCTILYDKGISIICKLMGDQ